MNSSPESGSYQKWFDSAAICFVTIFLLLRVLLNFLFWITGNKEILHNVSGKFPGSQLIAIMGPSGAGKSTLLDALSGFKTTGVDGSILLNGRRRDLSK